MNEDHDNDAGVACVRFTADEVRLMVDTLNANVKHLLRDERDETTGITMSARADMLAGCIVRLHEAREHSAAQHGAITHPAATTVTQQPTRVGSGGLSWLVLVLSASWLVLSRSRLRLVWLLAVAG